MDIAGSVNPRIAEPALVAIGREGATSGLLPTARLAVPRCHSASAAERARLWGRTCRWIKRSTTGADGFHPALLLGACRSAFALRMEPLSTRADRIHLHLCGRLNAGPSPSAAETRLAARSPAQTARLIGVLKF